MTARDLDRALRQAFRFEAADLALNREGRMSPRQTALLQAGRAGMWLSLGVFVAVMLGAVGFVAFQDARLGTPGGGGRGTLAVIAGVAVAAIAIGYLASRKHLSAAGSRRLHVSEGTVEVVSEREGDCRVRIGGTALRLSGPDALEAFSPGEAYRVYYLAGPVALVLSGETLSGPASKEGREAAARTDAAERETAAAQISVVRQGYVIVVLIGVLALAIPFAGAYVGDLPARLRPMAWLALLAITVGFAWFAIARLTRERRRGS